MRRPPEARITGEHYSDLRLWQTATYFLDLGVHRKEGSFYPLLAASLFSFFAFEAYLNEVGRQLDRDVWKRERDCFCEGEISRDPRKVQILGRQERIHVSS